MTYFRGKSGADAVFFAVKAICKVVTRYQVKLGQAIDDALAGGVIDSGQATAAHALVDGILVTCSIWELISGNSGF